MTGPDVSRLRAMSNSVAIIGVGDTDYAKDYRSGARGNAVERGSHARTAYQLAITAFQRTLDDAGIDKSQIDGVCVGGGISTERISEILGIDPDWTGEAGAAEAVIAATQAIHVGLCTTVVCLMGNAQRSNNAQFGGPGVAANARTSYVYYAPWGQTSQGALYALSFRAHQLKYGTTEEQLGAVAVAFRKHATMNPNAVMQQPLTIDDYMESQYIVEPLHLFDYTIINDGGVAIILQRADMANDAKQTPVLVSGVGWHELNVDANQLRPRIDDFYRSSHRAAARSLYPMAALSGPKDVDVYGQYDSFSVHLLYSLEGYGFCGEGEAGAFIQGGRIEIGGEIPCNTSGGHLSESYLQGWAQNVELVRQLRGGLGARQVEGAEVAQYNHDASGACYGLIYTKGR